MKLTKHYSPNFANVFMEYFYILRDESAWVLNAME